MSRPVLFCFDYLDPLSFVLEKELASLSSETSLQEIRRVPLELRSPPEPMLDPEDEGWSRRWREAVEAAASQGLELARPPFLPWSRKAHELVLHAAAKGVGGATHQALFEAAMVEGRDIGRVDVLVEISRGMGLDAHEAKVVLDVDRYTEAVAELGREARAAGAREPATLLRAGHTLRGFHNRDALRTFLLR